MRHAQHHTKGRTPPPAQRTRSLMHDMLFGGVYGAGIGAAVFAIAVLLRMNANAWESGWWILVVFPAIFLGTIAGAVIGSIFVAMDVDAKKGALLGAAIGFLFACYFLSGNIHPGPAEMLQGALCIATGALVGRLAAYWLHTPW